MTHGRRSGYVKGCRCATCQEAHATYTRAYRKKNGSRTPRQKEITRERHLERTYGISAAQWDLLFDAQGRSCALCQRTDSGSKRGWHVDHDHETGRVRGILCIRCNTSLAGLGDNVAGISRALAYVRASDFSAVLDQL